MKFISFLGLALCSIAAATEDSKSCSEVLVSLGAKKQKIKS